MPESLSHPFVLNKHLVSASPGSGSRLGIGDTQVSKRDPFPDLRELNLKHHGSSKDRGVANKKWVVFSVFSLFIFYNFFCNFNFYNLCPYVTGTTEVNSPLRSVCENILGLGITDAFPM